jgi:triacylglycerol lipase
LAPNAPVVFHIHGGGYLFGSPAASDARHRHWAKSVNCAVASVQYRLAPETPFPGAIADCYAALSWLHAEAPKLGLDRTRIALAGESAGGGLAATLALTIRDRGGPKPCFQLLIYPMLDDRTGTAGKANPYAGEFVWDRAGNRQAWRYYLGAEPGVGDVSSHAAAARATDLAGLPPTFIGTGALDLFIDEDLDYARRLSHAGVPVEVYCAPGAYHGFDALAPTAKISQQFNNLLIDALKRAFGS